MSKKMPGEQLVHELALGTDVAAALEKVGLTPHQASLSLKQVGAKKALKARLALSRVQTELMAARFSPTALSHLVHLLNNDKPEVALKASLSILQQGLPERKDPAPKTPDKSNPHLPPLDPAQTDPEEMRLVLDAIVQATRQYRADQQEEENTPDPAPSTAPPSEPSSEPRP